jgi:hypothetical protein
MSGIASGLEAREAALLAAAACLTGVPLLIAAPKTFWSKLPNLLILASQVRAECMNIPYLLSEVNHSGNSRGE